MKIVEYVIPLGKNARKRHYHESIKGKIGRFSIQLEIFVDNEWCVAIRYDTAHGFAHVDRYYFKGSKSKQEINLEFSEVLTLADEDIRENWKRYQKEYLGVK